MGSTERCAGARDGLGSGYERGAAAFDLFNAALDFRRPCVLDLAVLEQAGEQPVCQLRPFLRRKLQGLFLNRIKLAGHGGSG
jgi:hypothetical protein